MDAHKALITDIFNNSTHSVLAKTSKSPSRG